MCTERLHHLPTKKLLRNADIFPVNGFRLVTTISFLSDLKDHKLSVVTLGLFVRLKRIIMSTIDTVTVYYVSH